MTRRLVVAIMVLASLSTIEASAEEPRVRVPVDLTPAMLEAIETIVTDKLKDPESARFSSHAATRNEKGGIIVCGLVNAKNSMGGYAGKQPYVGTFTGTDNDKFDLIGLGGNHPEFILAICDDAGINLN